MSPIVPPTPHVPWWQRPRTYVIGALAVLFLGGIGYFLFGGERWGTLEYVTRHCADDIWERGPEDECVGVSDGGYVFGDLADVSASIKQENDTVTDGSTPYVTIAVLIPMTTDETDKNRRAAVERQIRHEVQGAHLAQLRMNKEGAPRIRLVLANAGRGSTQYRPVADDLEEETASRHRLRAVVGFDVSEENTKNAISHLTKDLGIPVVGGPITATDLAMPGLARVVPPNEDQAGVLAGLPGDKGTFLVEDTRPGDSYVATLRDAFNKQRDTEALESEQYRSSGGSDDDPGLDDDFLNIAQNICQAGASDIYFAGRPPQLRQLVLQLGTHGCENTENRFRIITGSGASTIDSYVSSRDLRKWRKALRRVTVEYSAVGHPDAWEKDRTKAPEAADAREELSALREGFSGLGLAESDLEDSRLMTTYDATRTAIKNIRLQGGKDDLPGLDEVFNGWPRLKNVEKVHGTTGWICLDNDGNAFNKAIHLVQLDPEWKEGRKISFHRVAWPSGEKLTDRCTRSGGAG
ncbi:hypothetical protein DY218_24175 [Streptomyces triticagri]|uniref:Amino acid ABC transporter substrate-binding protein n=1 Tax=Streptomyces triticagri TaxID=2293568 RepID=A0A372M0V1_9ACTN|nr:ABC transporter substrate-binding protein [Streptomyces triticagri]RFU84143.1 hypothetical protein DY218_24175 [Streptomyces triticagri]